MSYRSSMAVCAFGLTTFLVGCSEPRPEFAPVQGTVRVNGKPDRGLLLRFTPVAGQENSFNTSATGTTDEQGKYTLKWEYRGEEGDGAALGIHRVTIIDTKVGYTPQGGKAKPSNVPYAYRDMSTTPLQAEVKAGDGSPQTIDFDVKR